MLDHSEPVEPLLLVNKLPRLLGHSVNNQQLVLGHLVSPLLLLVNRHPLHLVALLLLGHLVHSVSQLPFLLNRNLSNSNSLLSANLPLDLVSDRLRLWARQLINPPHPHNLLQCLVNHPLPHQPPLPLECLVLLLLNLLPSQLEFLDNSLKLNLPALLDKLSPQLQVECSASP